MCFVRRLLLVTVLTFWAMLLVACSGRVHFSTNHAPLNGSSAPSAQAPEPPPPPIVITAEQLAHDLEKYPDEAFVRYAGWQKVLEITGVVAGHSTPYQTKDIIPFGSVWGVEFEVPNEGGRKPVYRLHCHFEKPIPPDDPRVPKVAIGKKVTIRGELTGMQRDHSHASINKCVLVE